MYFAILRCQLSPIQSRGLGWYKNWRPITLLNFNYKQIATIYANQLKQVLPAIVKDDQKAYIEGQQIIENVRLTQDIISMCDENDSEGAIIFLDQQKAYDRIEWGYLKMCVEKFVLNQNFVTGFSSFTSSVRAVFSWMDFCLNIFNYQDLWGKDVQFLLNYTFYKQSLWLRQLGKITQ